MKSVLQQAEWRVLVSATVAVVAASAACAGAAAFPAHAVPASCADPVLLVHDMGRSGAEWASMRSRLERAGHCVDDFTYGPALPAAGAAVPVAGLGSLEDAAREVGDRIAALRARSGARQVDVVAHGAGALAVDRHLQRSATPREVRSLIAIGPMWRGTAIAGLADAEKISRSLGTYDTVLRMERPLVDPLCAGCRELIAGSDFLEGLERRGTVVPGVRYVNVISTADGLVQPALSAALPGMTSRLVQQVAPVDAVGHFGMVDDPVVQRMVIDALGTGSPTGRAAR
ncbi:hypothetical protein G4X40_20835 [Rhodococcus sp. D2-41]|uniref:esterase/lipase family protein n=1 Tax=Speluncibacter jeojiensis TaxID=2710754 RepID=UPI0024108BF5|nr:hypothetical protein [Rhodococcus sp. D2-41]MDG3012590.1 hypothetical protein [Rhodococcus sp. D2-41]